jgi:hypothetical protein
MHELYTLSAKLPDPKKPLVIMGNIGRCGSTLLTQIFECTNQIITYSEPFPIKDLALLYIKHGPSKQVVRMAKTLVRIYTRPLECMPDPVGYLIKPYPGPPSACAEIINQVYPDITRTIYLYREMEKVIQSTYKLSFVTPSLRLCYICCRLNGRLVSHMFKEGGYSTNGTNRTFDNELCIGTFMAALTGDVYRKM